MAAAIRQSSGTTATLVTAASGSISLPAAPVTGNKLVYCQAGDKNTGALTLAGFTEVYSLLSTSVSLYIWERVSDGTETTISPSWVTAGAGSELWYAEIEDTAVSGSTWQISAQASNITDELTTTSKSTGTTGTKASAGLGIAASGVDTANNVGSTTWSNSYTQAAAAAASTGAGGLSVATKSEAAGGTTDSTFTFTTADQCSAAIVVFAKVAAGGPALNANVSHPANSLFRLRFEVQETGGVAIASAFQLRFSKNGGAYTQVTTATDVRPAASAQFADGAATTDLLTSGTGTFVAGVGEEADAVTPSISLGASGHTELEYALTIFTGTVGDTFDFRVYKNDGTALDSYAVTPRVTVAASGGATTYPQAVTANVTSTASITKRVAKALAATATSTATQLAQKVILKAVTATATSTATLTRSVGKPVTATVTSTASAVKRTGKTVQATVTSTATLSALKVFLRTLTATVTSAATLTRRVGKPVTATATSTASITRQTAKRVTATVTSTASLLAQRVFLKAVTATVTSTATISRRIGKTVTATVSTAGSIVKRVATSLSAVVTAAGALLSEITGGQPVGTIEGDSRTAGVDSTTVTFMTAEGAQTVTVVDEAHAVSGVEEGVMALTGSVD